MENLNKIRAKLNVKKGHYNKFADFYYRNLEDIMEAVKPLCVEHGCILNITDELIAMGDKVYIKATATISDSKGSFSSSAFAREPEQKKAKMDESQTTGSTSSYARKYACNALFLLDDNSDPDSQNNAPQPQQQANQGTPDPKQTPPKTTGTATEAEAIEYINKQAWPEAKKVWANGKAIEPFFRADLFKGKYN